MENYDGVYIDKITMIKNVLMQHTTDERRISFNRKIYEIEFDNGDKVYTVMKPKKMQCCFNGIDFTLKETIFTRKKVLFEDFTKKILEEN